MFVAQQIGRTQILEVFWWFSVFLVKNRLLEVGAVTCDLSWGRAKEH